MLDSYEQDLQLAKKVANDLKTIHQTDFGGKPHGRYKISRELLCQLTQRKRLNTRLLNCIVSECFELGLVVTDIGDDFSVLEVDTMRGYRQVPVRVFQLLLNNAAQETSR